MTDNEVNYEIIKFFDNFLRLMFTTSNNLPLPKGAYVKKFLPIIALIFSHALFIHASELSLHNSLAITKEENDFFCHHLKILLDYCEPLAKEDQLLAKNPIYNVLHRYGQKLSQSNDLSKLIESENLAPSLSEYINLADNPVNEFLTQQVKSKKADWEKAKTALNVNRFVQASNILKSYYPTFTSPLVGTGEARGIEFMKSNADFQPDENFEKHYFACFIYKFIYAKRIPQ